jgi:hypothetical protein
LEERSRRDSTQGRDKGSIRRWAAAVLCERCSAHLTTVAVVVVVVSGVWWWWWWCSDEGTTPAKQQTTPAKEAKSAAPKKETPQDRLKRLMRQKLNKQSTTRHDTTRPTTRHDQRHDTRALESLAHPIMTNGGVGRAQSSRTR